MATITITGGDFGTGVIARFASDEMYLPDPKQGGALRPVSYADIAQIESVSSDHAGKLKDAVKLSARGFAIAGPVGLAAGLLAARKASGTNFSVLMHDGRKLLATADAATYADLHSAFLAARSSVEGHGAADQVIAKYLNSSPSGATAAPVGSTDVAAERPVPSQQKPSPAVFNRPTFGRRKS